MKRDASRQPGTKDSASRPTGHARSPTKQEKGGISRREFFRDPTTFGVSLLALGGLGSKALAGVGPNAPEDIGPVFEDDQAVPIRKGLGIVIVGASSGMGAEMARQYADHGACIVLAARRTERLEQVAREVSRRGGVPHVVTTDVRNERECRRLVRAAIRWLASRRKVIDLLVLAPIRAQICAFGPGMSTEVWRNVTETNYFGPAYCLKHAVPHLKENKSTVFYFNSISSSVATPFTLGYTTSKHAWRAIQNAVKFENPELTVVSSQFNAVDTEAFDKELTCFNDDKRYCPSFTKTYSFPESQLYPEPLAVEKAIQAIESQQTDVFLSLLNKAAWLVGHTRQELGWFLTVLEHVMGFELVQELESKIKQAFNRPGAARYIERLLRKLSDDRPRNELVHTAAFLLSVDRAVSLYLLALDDLLDEAVLLGTRQKIESDRQAIADGSFEQLAVALSSGTLSPSGIADDDDGFAPVTSCPPVILGR